MYYASKNLSLVFCQHIPIHRQVEVEVGERQEGKDTPVRSAHLPCALHNISEEAGELQKVSILSPVPAKRMPLKLSLWKPKAEFKTLKCWNHPHLKHWLSGIHVLWILLAILYGFATRFSPSGWMWLKVCTLKKRLNRGCTFLL